jgi:spore germination protein
MPRLVLGKRKKLLLFIAAVLAISIVSGLIWYLYVNKLIFNTNSGNSANNSTLSQSTTPTVDLPTPAPINSAPTPSTQLKQIAWLPDWDYARGWSSLQRNYRHIQVVSPVWYYLDKNGNVKISRVGQSQLRQFTRQHNIKLMPSIAGFSSDDFQILAKDETKLRNLINLLKQDVDRYNLDGIDIDFESHYLDDQGTLFTILRELYAHLDSKGKRLSIAVMPAYTDAKAHAKVRLTRATQNWSEIATMVHEVRIMTYGYSSARQSIPGPHAPLDWMEANLRYAARYVPASKTYLGINNYAFGGWATTTPPQPYLHYQNIAPANRNLAQALNYTDIVERRRGKVQETLDPISGEKILTYRRSGQTYITYFMDGDTVRLRKQLAQRYGIAGIAYWRLGAEDSNNYK